ncbi:hypothetical protein MTR67_020486 [Solanum verrucosum]|uniref:Uncharacterized protein n=1 Tax=Solanum verrucosum TaxID=315347 RepID=A0AAF0QUZ1_SOLVR|nr:hypothetical protein MTR67_020486 [Solanum verrucosum]
MLDNFFPSFQALMSKVIHWHNNLYWWGNSKYPEKLVEYFGSIATSYVVLDEACENDNRCGIRSEKDGDGNSFADDSLLLDERT